MSKGWTWQLVEQISAVDEILVHEGTYQECLKEMKNIKVGYICRCNDGDFIYIAKSKGWK